MGSHEHEFHSRWLKAKQQPDGEAGSNFPKSGRVELPKAYSGMAFRLLQNMLELQNEF
jgi:hypothetical protein